MNINTHTYTYKNTYTYKSFANLKNNLGNIDLNDQLMISYNNINDAKNMILNKMNLPSLSIDASIIIYNHIIKINREFIFTIQRCY